MAPAPYPDLTALSERGEARAPLLHPSPGVQGRRARVVGKRGPRPGWCGGGWLGRRTLARRVPRCVRWCAAWLGVDTLCETRSCCTSERVHADADACDDGAAVAASSSACADRCLLVASWCGLDACSEPWALYVPLFIASVSAVQIGLFYSVDTVADYGLRVPVVAAEAWRVIGCLFAHGSAWHLWNNMIVQLTAGVIFEVLHGPLACALVYWASGVLGTLFQVVLWRASAPAAARFVLIGASAAGYGVTFAYVGHLLMNWRETPLRLWWAVALVAIAVAELVTYATNALPNVAHGAHLGGALAGLLFGCVVVQNVRVYAFERRAWVVALGCLALGTVALLVAFGVS
jgi:membrane associated rhomboid family serine protease